MDSHGALLSPRLPFVSQEMIDFLSSTEERQKATSSPPLSSQLPPPPPPPPPSPPPPPQQQQQQPIDHHDEDGEMNCKERCRFGCRVAIFAVWALLVVVPVKFIENVLLKPVLVYLMTTFRHHLEELSASVVLGILISYAVVIPIVQTDSVPNNVLCSSYLSLISFLAGNITFNFLVFVGVMNHVVYMKNDHDSNGDALHLSGSCFLHLRFLKSRGPACYIGLLTGLLFSFPVASVNSNDSFVEWCHPIEHKSIIYIILFCFFYGAFNNFVKIDYSDSPVRSKQNKK